MIKPVDFKIEDFISPELDDRSVRSLRYEDLSGSTLIDNLILLRFLELYDIQQTLAEKYSMPFAWLNIDPTPPELEAIAKKHKILVERGKALIVYIPLGHTVDDSLLQIDIPNYQIRYIYIADCNYKFIQEGTVNILISNRVADFRPLLVLRKLIIDCINKSGTDIHLVSSYEEKRPVHRIEYRIKKEVVQSEFEIDGEMLRRVINTAVQKLSPSSSADLGSNVGIVTEVSDLFGDSTCDLRIAGMRTSAGFYVVIAIQTTDTTTMTVDELGFPNEDVKLIREIAKSRTGLTLVTGERRSGKNTTIFAMINEIVHEPIRIIEYSNPIENRMPFPQINYQGDVERLRDLIMLAKKQDIDIAILNEIPNSEVAFAVRDLVNSSIGVITTTHIDRLWHIVNKLREFFKDDYKTIISQLNVVINQKLFIKWSAPGMQKRLLVKENGPFEMFAYKYGVRQYFVPQDVTKVKLELQPLVEILIVTDAIKTSMLNFDELWRSAQMIELQMNEQVGRLEHKVAAYINDGRFSLDQMRRLYRIGG